MDDLLHPFINAATEKDASRELDALFAGFIQPLCTEVTRRYLKTYGNGDRADQELEIQAEAMLQLAARLRMLRNPALAAEPTGLGAPAEKPIENLRAYVVSTVFNAAYARIRANCPKRSQLQNRIRYLLRNDGRFALWKTENGEYLAGVLRWKRNPLGVAVPASRPPAEAGTEKLDRVMLATFERAGGPLGLGELVSLMAAALGVTDSDPVQLEKAEPTAHELAVDLRLIQRQHLQNIWQEVLELPVNQRTALLLNLRDADGHGVIELLPATGIATLRQLATATGLTAEALAQIWNELPLDDHAISNLLGVTRQQVINLRKSARDRLNRRLRKAGGNPEGNSPSKQSAGGTTGTPGRTVQKDEQSVERDRAGAPEAEL